MAVAAQGGFDATDHPVRSRGFRARSEPRYWWHRLADTDYEPPLYATLTAEEWGHLRAWHHFTEGRSAGEINVPAMSLLQGLVAGNGLRRVVQLGHMHGYSTLLLGFMLRAMGGSRQLVSFDLDPDATAFVQSWLRRTGLEPWVTLHVGDSADPAGPAIAEEASGGPPQLVLVDSSHAYAHTVRELELWMPALAPGGLAVLHDISEFARAYDATDQGGARRAFTEWRAAHPEMGAIDLNGFVAQGADADELVYRDAPGLGLLQRPG
jgi:predicted O-methyltransferase YrrM